jgi:hypothetical protein
MIRTFMIAAACAAVLTTSPAVFGRQPDHGTADQAKAMLLKAEAPVKTGKTKALELFNAGGKRIPGRRTSVPLTPHCKVGGISSLRPEPRFA